MTKSDIAVAAPESYLKAIIAEFAAENDLVIVVEAFRKIDTHAAILK